MLNRKGSAENWMLAVVASVLFHGLVLGVFCAPGCDAEPTDDPESTRETNAVATASSPVTEPTATTPSVPATAPSTPATPATPVTRPPRQTSRPSTMRQPTSTPTTATQRPEARPVEPRPTPTRPTTTTPAVTPPTPPTAQTEATEKPKEQVDIPAFHVVRQGDTLTKIAKKYGTTPAALAKLNGKKLRQLNVLWVGQKIKLRK